MDAPLEVAMPRGLDAGALARRHIEARFRGVVADNAVGNLKMVVSELVNNAVLHGAGDITLLVALRGDVLYVEVTEDEGGHVPTLRPESVTDPGGRGLRIVDALARTWGAHARDGMTRVWAEVEPA